MKKLMRHNSFIVESIHTQKNENRVLPSVWFVRSYVKRKTDSGTAIKITGGNNLSFGENVFYVLEASFISLTENNRFQSRVKG